MKTVRCFLALNLNVNVIREITKTQKELIPQTVDNKINWVPPQNIHVTIRFLGAITEPMIQAIKDSLETLIRNTAPIPIQTKGLGLFKEKNDTAGILWAGVTPEKELDEFHSQVCKHLENTGFKEKVNQFIPHATIGRIKDLNTGDIDNIINKYKDIQFGGSVIKNLVCYQSTLSSKGADYKLLWRLSLSGQISTKTVNDNPANVKTAPPLQNSSTTEIHENKGDQS